MQELDISTTISNVKRDENAKKIHVRDKIESIFKTRVQMAKESFLEWSSRTDMNNYGKIFEYKGNILAQIIWIIIFLVLSSLTVIIIQQSISAYLNYSVTTTYETIYESPAEFPTITICASNPFGTLEAKNLVEELSIKYRINFSRVEVLVKLAKNHAANPSYGDENRKKLGFSINDITFCLFNKVDCRNDLHWIWLYDYGNCFQFNSGLNLYNQKIDLAKSSRLDKGYGLILEYVPRYEAQFIGFDSGVTPFGKSVIIFRIQDFVVLVHNSSNIISSSTKLSHTEKGTKLSISIKRTLISKQASPHSDCIDLSSYSSVLYDYILQSNYSYRQIDCLDLCIQQKIINECQCYNLKYPDLNTQVKPCLNFTQFECANNAINNFGSAECFKTYCPLECSSIEFELENSYGSTLSKPYFTSDANSYSSLIVSYSSFKYTQVTESPQTTLINFLTQLGGSLGMFITFSVFTFFESIEILVLMLYAVFCRKLKNLSVDSIEPNL